jgi:excisionase family DNA binding protein
MHKPEESLLEAPEERRALTLSVVDAGRLVGLGRGAAYRAARRGDLPAIKVGGRVRVLRGPLMRLLGAELDEARDATS